LGGPFLVDLQARRVAVADIGATEFGVFGIDPDATDRDAADDRSADAARTERFEEDHEPASETGVRRYARQKHAVLELLQIIRWLDHRPADAEHVEAVAVAARVVAHFDDPRLAELRFVVAIAFAELAAHESRRVEEGVVRRRGDLQLLAGHHGLERIAGHVRLRSRGGRSCPVRRHAPRRRLPVV
jgi:hypothetical protein